MKIDLLILPFPKSLNIIFFKNKNNKILFAFFLILLGLISIASHFISVYRSGGNGWAIGEWLINYNGGFVRRGLIGQLIVLSKLKGNALLILIFTLQLTLLTIIWVYLMFKLIKFRFSWTSILVVLHPCGLLMISWDQYLLVRKEIMGLSALILLILSFRSFRYQKIILLASFALYLVSIFSSEVNIFIGPMFLYVLWNNRTKSQKIIYLFLVLFLISMFIAFFSAINFSGTLAQSVAICHKIQELSLNTETNCSGAVEMIGKSLSEATNQLNANLPENLLFLIFLIVAIIPILSTDWAAKNKFLIVLTISSISPLFFIAWDYGRWLFLIIIIMSIFYDENPTKESSVKPFLGYFVVIFLLFFGVGHTNNILSNGWIAAVPMLFNLFQNF